MAYGNALDAVGDTPLVDLPDMRPDDGASLHLKWEGANPTGSLKDRMALAMIEAPRERGDLGPGDPVVEFTGGSTGSSLGFVCSVLDHPLYVVTADCVASEKTASMRALGAEVEVVETPNGEAYDGLFADLRDAALDIEAETGAYFTDQFNNTDQLDGYASLGRELLDEVPDLDEFVMTVGTGGSAMGVARYLRANAEDVTITLVEPEASPVLSEGRAGSHGVQGTAIVESPPLVESEYYDQVRTLPETAGRTAVRELSKQEGLLVGTSTGMNVAAAQQIASERDPGDTVVTVACDTGLRYLSGGLYEGLEGTTFSLE